MEMDSELNIFMPADSTHSAALGARSSFYFQAL